MAGTWFMVVEAPAQRSARAARVAQFVTVCVVALAETTPAAAQPAAPVYANQFSDAVTGPNCTGTMNKVTGCNTPGGWFVTAGADVYSADRYERPTAQTFRAGAPGAPVASEYFGYLDIVSAQYGFDNRYLYFQLKLYSPYLYKNDGTVDMGVFGSGTYYGVQLGSSNANDGQLLLRTEQNKDRFGQGWSAQKNQGWFDQNNSVSGPGGVNTPDEEDRISNSGGFNGYETMVVQTDGYLQHNNGSKTDVLFSRSFLDGPINGNTHAFVELAFDYLAFNSFCVSLGCQIDPRSLPYLVFESVRGGSKDPQNYLWNDKYTAAESGSPYQSNKLENVYELDNLRVDATVVPEPSSVVLLASGLAAMGWMARRRRSR